MPAAAVFLAPMAYIGVVAVKKLVVGFLLKMTGPPSRCVSGSALTSFGKSHLHLTVWCGIWVIFCFAPALVNKPCTSQYKQSNGETANAILKHL